VSTAHEGIAAWLGANIDGLTWSTEAGGNVFVDSLPSSPDRCVAVYSQGGFEADSKLEYDAPVFQLVIRSTADPRWALETWQKIYDELHALRHVTLPNGRYLLFALVVQSSPVRIGADDSGRAQYSMNVRAEVTSVEVRP
jgi:hypothetical protein